MQTVPTGNNPTITALITDRATGNPVDPTTIEVRSTDPDGTVTTWASDTDPASFANPTVGTHEFTYPAALTAPGTYRVFMGGTAGVLTGDIIIFEIPEHIA